MIAVWPLSGFSKKCVDKKTSVERSQQSALKAIFHKAEFSAWSHISFCLKTNWRRVGGAKNSAYWKTALKHGRRDGRTGMQRATLGKSGSEAASQLQDRIARAFPSNSLVNTMDMTAAIQYILTAAQSLGSQVYYKKSQMTILGLAGVLLYENEQA